MRWWRCCCGSACERARASSASCSASTFHYTEEGWNKLTRNVALFFLATAVVNEAVRLGFADAHITALNRVFTGLDIWILFKIFIVMPRQDCSSGGRSGCCSGIVCQNPPPTSPRAANDFLAAHTAEPPQARTAHERAEQAIRQRH